MTHQLQRLLSAAAGKDPAKDAVVYKGSRITYGELQGASNRLAGVLVRAGVGRGDRVGLYLNKSLQSIVGIFAILKAGAAYVPLDPASPLKRVSYILGDCGIRHLITTTERMHHLRAAGSGAGGPAPEALTYILADRESPALERERQEASVIPWREVEEAPELEEPVDGVETDLAYILYTSGSTGVPKGVMISHRAALTFIDWSHDTFAISSQDIVSNHAPLHFDLSIFDIFTTIKAGATLVLVPEGMATFPITLTQFIVKNRISAWYSVPSALILLLTRGAMDKHAFPDLRLILFAGEVFPVKYLRQLREVCDARLFNLYGPTETNVCTFYEVREIAAERMEPFPIGKAIANCEVFAVNERGEKAGPGEVGELYVRGPGLMSGYWGWPEKTREVLLPNPFQPHFEEKVYRTGDLVRTDEEGAYLYLGRIDNMVKSRGYRIELGEIETVLYSHPAVKEAAVVAVPDEEVANRLLAFIVRDGSQALTVQDLQGFCLDRIPRYMVPETIEFRDALPQTSTGKVDRQSLRQARSERA